MEVILHSDPSAPEIAVNIWYHVGSGDEEPGKSGFAHLFEHMMFQGAKHIGQDVHFDTLKEIGGTSINGTTNGDRTNYFETVPRHQIETALWLESDRMGYMLDLLNEESFLNQVDVVRNERRQNYDNRPYGGIRFEVAAALYPEGHPYRYLTIGRHEDLENADLADVRAFFKKWYVPSNATLVLAGDFETDDAKALVEKWFGSFPKLPRPDHHAVAAPALEQNFRKEVPDKLARLDQVQYTWHGPAQLAEGSFEMNVASQVLGASGWGRLYRRLVVEEKLCSRVYAYNHGQQFSGAFNIVAQVKPGSDRARVEAIIQEEVDRIIKEPITKAELDRVIVGTESGFVWGLESLGGRANQLQWFNHYTGDPGYAKTYLERMRAVTPATVKQAAKQYLSAPRAEIIAVPKGDRPGKSKPKGSKASGKKGDAKQGDAKKGDAKKGDAKKGGGKKGGGKKTGDGGKPAKAATKGGKSK
jgi:predicted Zn-dependent peptidase